MRSRLFKLFDQPYFPAIAVPFVLYLAPLLSGQVLFWGLPATQFVPWAAYALEQMRQGILPLWNPLNGMGAPLLANYQLALFYPPGWSVYLAGMLGGAPGIAWMQTFLVPLHLAWAGVGMALLGQRLGFSRLGQSLAGLAFGMSGYWVARAGFYSMIWGGVWLPWIILGASAVAVPVRGLAAAEGGGWRTVIKPGLWVPVALMLLAGHAQLGWYTLTLAGLWVVAGGWVNGGWRGVLRALWVFGLNGLLAAGAAAVQLLPTAEFLMQSQRAGAVDLESGLTYSFWPWRLLTFLAPGFFGSPAAGNFWGFASYWEDATYSGFLPLVLGVGVLLRAGRRGNSGALQPLVRLAAGIMVVGMLLAVGNNLPLFPFLYRWVPTFSLFNAPARWMVWVLFGLSLLVGVGAGGWRRPSGKALRNFKRLLAAAMSLTLGAVIAWLTLHEIQVTFIEATALLGIWAVGACVLTLTQPRDIESPAFQRWSRWVVAWVALDLLWAGWNSQPTIPANYFAPTLPAASGTPGRVFLSAEDEYALKFRRFFRFRDYRPIEDWQHLRELTLPNMNLLADTRFAYVNNFDPMLPGRYARWMKNLGEVPAPRQAALLRLMNVDVIKQRTLDQVLGIVGVKTESHDRVRWLGCATWTGSEQEAWQQVQDGAGGSPAALDTLLVLEGVGNGQPACAAGGIGSARIVEERPDRVKIEVDGATDGYVVLADSWYPGWQVWVDGQLGDILHANYLFRGLAVPAGKHHVEFVYRPISFYIGAAISGSVLLFVLLWTCFITYRVQLLKF